MTISRNIMKWDLHIAMVIAHYGPNLCDWSRGAASRVQLKRERDRKNPLGASTKKKYNHMFWDICFSKIAKNKLIEYTETTKDS
jgi:hypothetical protein